MIELESRNIRPRAFAVALALVLLAGCTVPSDSSPSDANAPAAATTDSANSAAEQQPAGESEVAVNTSAPQSIPDDAGAKTASVPVSTSGGRKVTGRVVFDGPAPERKVINMSKDAQCIKLHGDNPVLTEDVIVAPDGGLKNAFVYIRRGVPKGDYPVPAEAVMLHQKDCMYRPRVQGLRLGQRLLVANGDPVTHNVRSFPIKSRPFNFGQPPGSEPRERIFEAAEREIEVQCDIHPWMHAYLFVMDHPFYAVTEEDGAYTIENLPPGEYTLAAWHEKLGRQQQPITVADGDLADVNFTYRPE
jgi:Carboxypeptidase regulatory-like domain